MVLAWLVPGAGHFYLGRRVRGVIIFVVIGATFWGGMAVGGVLTMDYYNSRGWFIAQMCTGAHGLAGWKRQKDVYEPAFKHVADKMNAVFVTDDYLHSAFQRTFQKNAITSQEVISLFMHGISESKEQNDQLSTRVVGEVDAELQKEGFAMLYPTENIARAYAGVAGMLNLLCIIDAIILSFMGTYGEPPPLDPTMDREAA